jgi:ketosteroid isomerase-like protein
MITAESVRQVVKRLAHKSEDAFRRRGVQAVAAFYTEDAALTAVWQDNNEWSAATMNAARQVSRRLIQVAGLGAVVATLWFSMPVTNACTCEGTLSAASANADGHATLGPEAATGTGAEVQHY